jgi:hypothetical protein
MDPRIGFLPMDRISRKDIAALKSKYEEMLRMRLFDLAHPGGDPRREMAALAARFPGALRELDEASLEQIHARLEALSQCLATGSPPDAWMCASALFHRLTRGALAAKRWLAGRKSVDEDVIAAFLESLEGSVDEVEAREWAQNLAAVASPPHGRLSELVFEHVARGMNLPFSEARALVVGTQRRVR